VITQNGHVSGAVPRTPQVDLTVFPQPRNWK